MLIYAVFVPFGNPSEFFPLSLAMKRLRPFFYVSLALVTAFEVLLYLSMIGFSISYALFLISV
jgi:glycopeptide antibiotics resistance protein